MSKGNFISKIFGIILVFVMVGSMLAPVQASGDTESEGTSQWTTNGPYGGYINSLAMAPTNPDIIYAGTQGGLFKTIDAGANWVKTGLPEAWVRVVQVDPDNPDIVYAGIDDGIFRSINPNNGIYKSEDGGSTWTQKGLTGAWVSAIAIDPLNPDILYAGTGQRRWDSSDDIVGIFKSTDGGETWQEKLSEGLDAVAAVLIDTDNSSYIYAGVYPDLYNDDGLRKSTDGGETWVSRGPDEIVALAMTPAGSSSPAIYAIGGWGTKDVYKSADGGDNWTPTNIPFVRETSPLSVDPNNPNITYAGKLYKSTDGAGTWSEKANGLPRSAASSIVIDPRNSDVYVGLEEGGVYKSTDGAESWNFSSQGMDNTFIEGLAVHPTSSDTVFVAIKGYGHYLAKTTDGGTSWDYLLGSPTDQGAVTIDPQNPSTIYAGFGWRGRTNIVYAIDKSIDGGQSWTSTGYLFDTMGYHYVGVSDIWVNPSNSSTIVVTVAGYPTVGGGVYRSTDSGETWQHPRELWATTLASDPTDHQILYFGTQHCGYITRSTDGGSSWTDISPSAPVGECPLWEVRDIEVDLNSHVYAATDEGLIKWDGSDWTNLTGLPTDDITALAIDRSTSPGTIYAGTRDEGVFVSEDGGSTWIPFNEGLGNLNITNLAVSASQPKMLYAGTGYGGVYSRMIGDLNNPPYEPVNPSPSNHTTGVSIDADLSWSGGDPDVGDTVTYDIYFGTSSTPPSVSNDQSGITYDPGTLANSTKYYWKVVAEDNHGATTSGPLWDFTTQPAVTYNLTISSTSGGNVTTPGEGTYTYNASEVADLVATPDANYSFINWTGDVSTIANVDLANTNITMNGNYSIVANFAEGAPAPVWSVGGNWVYNCSYENPGGNTSHDTCELEVTVVGEEAVGDEACYKCSGVFEPPATRDAADMPLTLHIETADIWNSKDHLEYVKMSSAIAELPGLPSTVTWNYTGDYGWPYEVGKTWSASVHVVAGVLDEITEVENKVLGVETVTVPAGTFECYHIVTYEPTSPDNYTNEHWFNTDDVKSVVKEIDRFLWAGEETRELVSYSGGIPPAQYNLTINSTSGGNVTTPGEGTFTCNASEAVDLVATADANHTFVNWTGDVGTIGDVDSRTTSITMNGNYTIMANFEEGLVPYNVTVKIEPATTHVSRGGSFTIDAVIDNPDAMPVAMHNVRLNFDPDYFTVDSVSLVDFPEDMGAPTIDNVAGQVDYDPHMPTGQNTTNTHIISARINCTAKSLVGNSTISWVYTSGPPPRYTKVVKGTTDYLGGNMNLMFNGLVEVVPGATLEGHVDLQGLPATNITVRFFYPGTQNEDVAMRTHTITDSNGNFNISGLTSGIYDVGVKGSTSLSNLESGVDLTGGTVYRDFGVLLEGDASGDDYVDGSDFGPLSDAWLSYPGCPKGNWDASCDFSRDNYIDGSDFGPLSDNWLKWGDLYGF